jgi:hypothetical protein
MRHCCTVSVCFYNWVSYILHHQIKLDTSESNIKPVLDSCSIQACTRHCTLLTCALLDNPALLLTQVDVDVNSDAAETYNIEAMPTFKYFKVRFQLWTCKSQRLSEYRAFCSVEQLRDLNASSQLTVLHSKPCSCFYEAANMQHTCQSVASDCADAYSSHTPAASNVHYAL